VSLIWSTVDTAATYNLYRSTTSGGEGNAPFVTGLTAAVVNSVLCNYGTYSDTAVNNGSYYYYEIAAVTNNGEGAISNEVVVQPPNPVADFILYGYPPVLTLAPGTSGGIEFLEYAVGGYTGSETVSVSGLPAGVTSTVFPSIMSSGSDVSFCVSPSATPGSYFVNVTGVNGSTTHTLAIHLIIS
jgi:hypothetical protein